MNARIGLLMKMPTGVRSPKDGPQSAGAPVIPRTVNMCLMLAGICALGAVLRFAALGAHSLWSDEAFVVWVARLRWAKISFALQFDNHPPLYYLLTKAWTSVAGIREAAVRFPSALASSLCLPLTYLVARRAAGLLVSTLAVCAVAVSPLSIMAGQEARMYPLLASLALASTLALIISVERGGTARWAAYVGAAAAMVYTHYLGFVVVIAQGGWIFFYERPHSRAWLCSIAVVALLFAPWLPTLWAQAVRAGAGCVECEAPTLSRAFSNLTALLGLVTFGGELWGMPGYFTAGTAAPWMRFVILLPFLVVLGWGVVSMAWGSRRAMLVILPLGLTVGVILAISLATSAFEARWISFLVPFYAIVWATGVVALAERWRDHRALGAGVLAVVLLGFAVPVLVPYYRDPGGRAYDWRSAGAFIEQQRRPGDFFLFVTRVPEITLGYYIRTPDSALTLTPVEFLRSGAHTPRPTFSTEQVGRFAAQHPRTWLVETVPLTTAIHRRLLETLDPAFHIVQFRNFGGVWISLLAAK